MCVSGVIAREGEFFSSGGLFKAVDKVRERPQRNRGIVWLLAGACGSSLELWVLHHPSLSTANIEY